MINIANAISIVRYKANADFFSDIREKKYAHVKGEALSVLAYGKEGRRKYNDIDILVNRKDVAHIENVLLKHEYNSEYSRSERVLLFSQSHQIVPYVKKIKNIENNIDINFDIFWGEYEKKRIEMDAFLSDVIDIEIYGVKVKTLPPIKAIIHLMLHHYKDMNSIYLLATRNSIRYNMFKDVFYLLMNNLDEIKLDILYSLSTQYEIIPYLYYVLYYTGQVFDDKVLKKYIEAFRTLEGDKLLNCYGLCENERKEWKCDFQTRLEANDLFGMIKDDLTYKDLDKICLNRSIFGG